MYPIRNEYRSTNGKLRGAKGWSQSDLADKSCVTRVMISKYERNEAVPSIDAEKMIADVLEGSLAYIVGEGINNKLDKKTTKGHRIWNCSKKIKNTPFLN